MTLTDVFTYNQHFVAMMNIINMSRLNPPESGHKHHIIPKCWFRMNNLPIDNSKDNLVLLSYEDHVKVHKLAYLCTTDKMKRNMAYAYHRLTKGEILDNSYWKGENNPFYGKTHTEEVCNKLSEINKGHIPWNMGKHNIYSQDTIQKMCESHKNISEDTRRKMSESHKGKPMSAASRKALYEANKGRKRSAETCRKISESLKGIIFSDETKQKMSAAKKGKSWKLIDGKRVWCNKNEVDNGK